MQNYSQGVISFAKGGEKAMSMKNSKNMRYFSTFKKIKTTTRST